MLLSRFYQIETGKKYLKKCFETSNFYKKSKTLNKPKVSIIIPIFNCENSIKFSISSIQNQRLKEIEIILVNDFSKDNSKYVIENMQKYERRIFLINNNKNMGTLYSRNIGAMLAKGKYIFALDHDDMFLNDYIIQKIYKIAEINDYDIIGFKTIYVNKNLLYDEPFIKDKNDKIVIQPKLKFLSFRNAESHIWGKCIKNEIYKRAISLMGIKRSNTYLCYSEDEVILFMIFSIAKIYRYIPNFGLFHFVSKNSASFKLSRNHKIFARLFYADLIFDLTSDNFFEKKFALHILIGVKNYIKKRFHINKANKKYLKYLIKKMDNCSFISKINKDYLKNNFYS